MNLPNLKAGAKIKFQDKTNKDKKYSSRIEEITEESLKLEIPANYDLPLTYGVRISLLIDQDNILYKTATHIIEAKHDNGLFIIAKPKDWNKVQRRKHLRIPVRIKVKYRLKDNPEQFKKALMLDISSGGAKIRLNNSVEIARENLVALKFDTDKINDLIESEVRWVNEDDSNQYVGLRFMDFSQELEEQIIKLLGLQI